MVLNTANEGHMEGYQSSMEECLKRHVYFDVTTEILYVKLPEEFLATAQFILRGQVENGPQSNSYATLRSIVEGLQNSQEKAMYYGMQVQLSTAQPENIERVNVQDHTEDMRRAGTERIARALAKDPTPRKPRRATPAVDDKKNEEEETDIDDGDKDYDMRLEETLKVLPRNGINSRSHKKKKILAELSGVQPVDASDAAGQRSANKKTPRTRTKTTRVHESPAGEDEDDLFETLKMLQAGRSKRWPGDPPITDFPSFRAINSAIAPLLGPGKLAEEEIAKKFGAEMKKLQSIVTLEGFPKDAASEYFSLCRLKCCASPGDMHPFTQPFCNVEKP